MKKILCILLITLLLTGCGTNESNDTKKENESTTTRESTTTTTTTTSVKKLKISDKQVKDLIDAIMVNGDYTNQLSFYKKDKLTADQINNDIALMIGIKDNIKTKERYVSAEKVEASIKKILGGKIEVKHNTVTGGCGAYYKYDSKKKRYDTDQGICGYEFEPYVVEKTTKAYQKGDIIEIYRKAVLVETVEKVDGYNYEMYHKILTPDRKKVIAKKVEIELNSTDKYIDKSDEYKFTFIKEGECYIFSSVEKV